MANLSLGGKGDHRTRTDLRNAKETHRGVSEPALAGYGGFGTPEFQWDHCPPDTHSSTSPHDLLLCLKTQKGEFLKVSHLLCPQQV